MTENKELERARVAKRKAIDLYALLDNVNGIGISRRDGQYAVKINLLAPPAEDQRFLTTIEGVPVVLSVVGKITKQQG